MTNQSTAEQRQAVLALLSDHGGNPLDDSNETLGLELTSLGISSVTFMVIIVELEELLGRPFDNPEAFAEMKTVGDLFAAVGIG